jgi:hypothetical protein
MDKVWSRCWIERELVLESLPQNKIVILMILIIFQKNYNYPTREIFIEYQQNLAD